MAQVEPRRKELRFTTVSATDGWTVWTQRVVITDLDLRKVRRWNSGQVVKQIRDSDLEVHCDCPAFKYWGYKHIQWKRNYGIRVERREPRVRNPQGGGR